MSVEKQRREALRWLYQARAVSTRYLSRGYPEGSKGLASGGSMHTLHYLAALLDRSLKPMNGNGASWSYWRVVS